MDDDAIKKLKMVLRERDCPFFEDEELYFYLAENGQDFNATAYRCLILKSENTELSVSGLDAADTSSYFRRIASHYRKSNTRILGEG